MSPADPPLLLIDGDLVAYQCASRNSRSYDFGSFDDADQALEDATDIISSYCARMRSDDVLLAFGGRDNFRKAIYPEYKANRSGMKRPPLLAGLRARLEATYPSKSKPYLEGDDILGIMATRPEGPAKRIIISSDKDMAQIPGWLWNPSKDAKPRKVSPEEGERWHMYQTLVGDGADNYGGCPGIGPKKADRLLALKPSWADIAALYVTRGSTAEHFLIMARISRILQHTDYDYARKEPILWTPPLAPAPSPSSASTPPPRGAARPR